MPVQFWGCLQSLFYTSKFRTPVRLVSTNGDNREYGDNGAIDNQTTNFSGIFGYEASPERCFGTAQAQSKIRPASAKKRSENDNTRVKTAANDSEKYKHNVLSGSPNPSLP